MTGLSLVEISASSDLIYWSYYPQTLKIGSNWFLNPQKSRSIFRVKSTTGNTQKLKIMDPETGWMVLL